MSVDSSLLQQLFCKQQHSELLDCCENSKRGLPNTSADFAVLVCLQSFALNNLGRADETLKLLERDLPQHYLTNLPIPLQHWVSILRSAAYRQRRLHQQSISQAKLVISSFETGGQLNSSEPFSLSRLRSSLRDKVPTQSALYAEALYLIGVNFSDIGELSTATDLILRSIRSWEALRSRAGLANAYFALSVVLNKRGYFKQAVKQLKHLGKVIGKQGRTARAIRTVLNASGTKLKKRFVLEILE